MKYLLIIALCICSSFLFSQSQDSVKTKLEQYKQLYDQKLINNEDYSILKSNLLNLKIAPRKLPPSELYAKGRNQLIGGIITLSAGGAQIIARVVLRNTNVMNEDAVAQRRYDGIMFGLGGALTVIGGVITGVGANNMMLSKHSKSSASISFAGNGLTASISF